MSSMSVSGRGRRVRRVRRVRRNVIAALAVYGALACAGGGDARADLVRVERDSAGVRIVELGDVTAAALPPGQVSAEPLVRIGDAERGAAHELFSVVGATRLASGAIAVANAGTNEIRVYGPDGEHLRSIGRRGEGPGEFRMLVWLGNPGGDTIAAYDVGLRRMTWFMLDGAVARAVTLESVGAGGFPDPVGVVEGRVVAQTGFDRVFGRGERRDTIQLFRFDDEGRLADTLGRYPGAERFFYRGTDVAMQFPPIYGRDAHVHSAANRIIAGSTDAYAVDVYDGGALALRVRADHVQAAARPADLERERERQRQARQRSPFPQAVNEAVAVLPARATVPAFGSVRIARDGRLWVQEYTMRDDDPRRWTVFGDDGIPLLRVETPPRVDLLEIGESYVLGRARDADGVEQVLMYRLDSVR